MDATLLVYGAYGYTGRLVVEHAVETGLTPVIAGRRAGPLEDLAVEHDLESRAFTLDHGEVVRDRLADVDAVLNCAGPFRDTADPLVDACLDADAHYLDVSGEIRAFEALAEYDRAAERRGLTVLPGVGFDVVPTDCLAVHLEMALPNADELALAFSARGTFSRGTLVTAIEDLGEGGAVRRDGRIERVPLDYDERNVDFGDDAGFQRTVAIPWGDVSTAYYSTGVPNVTTYAAFPDRVADALGWVERLRPVLGLGPVTSALTTLVERVASDPDAEARERSEARIWGEIRRGDERRVARLRTPGTYALTARTAVESARRVLAGEAGPGFQTPGSAFGPDFVTTFDGVEREDAHEPGADREAGTVPTARDEFDPADRSDATAAGDDADVLDAIEEAEPGAGTAGEADAPGDADARADYGSGSESGSGSDSDAA
jgi:short subunit dehydrogenase-like uncharacterized protein